MMENQNWAERLVVIVDQLIQIGSRVLPMHFICTYKPTDPTLIGVSRQLGSQFHITMWIRDCSEVEEG